MRQEEQRTHQGRHSVPIVVHGIGDLTFARFGIRPKPALGVIVAMATFLLMLLAWTLTPLSGGGASVGFVVLIGAPGLLSLVAVRVKVDGRALHKWLASYLVHLLTPKLRRGFDAAPSLMSGVIGQRLGYRRVSSFVGELPARLAARGVSALTLLRPLRVELEDGEFCFKKSRRRGFAEWRLEKSSGETLSGHSPRPCRLLPKPGGTLEVTEVD